MNALRFAGRSLLLLGLLCSAAACTEATGGANGRAARAAAPAGPDVDVAGERRTVRDFRAFALNALLLPLLDPEIESPGRWADPSFAFACLDGSVTVDGERPDVDAPVPDSFTVRWRLDRCTPLSSRVEVSGEVDLHVELHPGEYVARIVPTGLTLSSAEGVDPLSEPFIARLSIHADSLPLGTASVRRPHSGS